MNAKKQSLSRLPRRIAVIVALCASSAFAQTATIPNVPDAFNYRTSPPPQLTELRRAGSIRQVTTQPKWVPVERPVAETTQYQWRPDQPAFPSLIAPRLSTLPSPPHARDLSNKYSESPQSPFQFTVPNQPSINRPASGSMRLVSDPSNADDLAALAIPDDVNTVPNQNAPAQVQLLAPPFAQPVPQRPQPAANPQDTSRQAAENNEDENLLPPLAVEDSTKQAADTLKRSEQTPPTQPAERRPSLDELAIPLDQLAIPDSAMQASDVLPNPSGQLPKVPTEGPLTQANQLTAPEKSEAAGKGETKAADQQTTLPSFFFPPTDRVYSDRSGRAVPYCADSFLATPVNPIPADPYTESMIYRGKLPVEVQRPWVEWWRPLYTGGIYPPAPTFFGETNLMLPHFMVYGDYRTGVGVHQNASGPSRSFAKRLNLDMDLKLTATERFHAFMGPLDRAGDVSRIDFSDSQNIEFVNRTDIRLDTGFFEGDVGAILGGMQGVDSQFDLPFTVGLIPLIYQNGIWLEDAMIGGAFAIPAKNSPTLGWANFDATFFAASDQVTSDAFQGDNNAAQVFGTAWFIDAYEGYIEADYAFVHDRVGGDRSYHNASLAFTRRYFTYLSNSIRFLSNSGQSLPSEQRTADGFLILLENSLISSRPNTFVPYANFFYGSGRPQSVARAGGSGGILRNTGINFETDGLTNYPTLDATANNSYGAALGVNMLGNNFSQQLVLELAALGVTGSQQFRTTAGDQYAAGVRYQRPLSYRWIFRADSMYGWARNGQDVFGNRVELRWKF